MSKYTCDKCAKDFKHKSSYTTHIDECIIVPKIKELVYSKPLIKWVGGKTQILDKVMSKFPKQMNNYHEIFLGGGSVLFALLDKINAEEIKVVEHVYVYDLNETLINFYKNVQSKSAELLKEVNKLNYEFIKCKDDEKKANRKAKNLKEAQSSREAYYYWTRINYNKLSQNDKNNVKGSAMFVFLNKTCFRGLFRIGPISKNNVF